MVDMISYKPTKHVIDLGSTFLKSPTRSATMPICLLRIEYVFELQIRHTNESTMHTVAIL